MRELAQIPIFPPGGFRGFGPLGLEGVDEALAPSIFSNFLSLAIGVMSIVAAIWFTIVLVTGAIGIISAGGDKTKVEEARKKITNGLVGLVVVISALFLISLLGTILGLPYILNPALFIFNFAP